jgi:hypothetical protein
MSDHLPSWLPTVYADMNVYRYLAYGDISIAHPERFVWVYSHVHLGEMARGGNTDALNGMQALGAVEIAEVLDQRFQPTGDIILRDYDDPHLVYEQHLEAVSGYENTIDGVVEILIRSFGADNYDRVRDAPDMLRQVIDNMTKILPPDARAQLMGKAELVSVELRDSINKHMRSRMPIDRTRRSLGITSEDRRIAEAAASPIDEIWNAMSPAFPGFTKEQVFGVEPSSATEGMQHTQSGAISYAHIMLNLVGLSPDGGLTKREKIRNILSDGQHLGMASYCNAFLSADQACCAKARAIYGYLGNKTNVLCFNYKKGYELNLGVLEGP